MSTPRLMTLYFPKDLHGISAERVSSKAQFGIFGVIVFICDKGPQATDTSHKQYRPTSTKYTDNRDKLGPGCLGGGVEAIAANYWQNVTEPIQVYVEMLPGVMFVSNNRQKIWQPTISQKK